MKTEEKKPKKVFVDGPITPKKIAASIANLQSETHIGAHDIFLGQVRADKIAGKVVKGIEYTAYEDMAEKVFHEIRETTFERFDLTSMHIYHSLGAVKTGELCLFVFTSSAHRKEAIQACNYAVEEIKANVPVFGKEIFEDETHQWKVNR
ncbi:MAG: molybdenum cofactor biosynthesis protein MoaE [Bacteroidota bacterium]